MSDKQPTGQGQKQVYQDFKIAEQIKAIDGNTNISHELKTQELRRLRDVLSDRMPLRHIIFVNEYFKDFNASKAAERTSYQPGYASELMDNPWIVDYLLITRKIQEYELNVTGDWVVGEWKKLAKVKISDLYDQEGKLIEPHKLPDWVSAAIASIKITERVNPITLTVTTTYEYKLHPKSAALDALGKHTGIYERDNKQKGTESKTILYLPDNGRNIEPKV
jgi:phage terminase small subunit